MKLVIFGLSVTSAWGNGHATHWRGILRALAGAGHRVVFFERDTPYYAEHRDMPDGEGYEVVLYPSWDEIRERAGQEVAGADAAIVTSYQADARLATELVLERCPGVRVFYDLDSPITLRLGLDAPWAHGLDEVDLVLSFTGGPTLDAIRTSFGARRVEALYGCVDTSVHRPVDAREAWALSYLGTYSADRQPAVEQLFLDVAERLPRERFVLAGAMYPAMQSSANVTQLAHLPPADHAAFYGASRATLNVTRADMKARGYSPSARIFEAAACGTAIFTDEWDGLGAFFEPGREILVVRSTEDVLAALAQSTTSLAALGARGRARALAEHTAERRAEELLAHLQNAR